MPENNCLKFFLKFFKSSLERLPTVFKTKLLSTVKNFIRIRQLAERPASSVFFIIVSKGQEECFAEVIIAVTRCFEEELNLDTERTRAGLFFCSSLSLKGKGIATMSNCL